MIKDNLIRVLDYINKIETYNKDCKKHLNKLSIMREKSIIDIFFQCKHDLNKIDEILKVLEKDIEKALFLLVDEKN